MPRVDIVTTMWSEIRPDYGARQEEELARKHWADMITQGRTVQRFSDSHESAWKIVGKLPMERENANVSSGSIDGSHRKSTETAAGVKLNEKLNELIDDLKEAARQIEEQVQQRASPGIITELEQRKHEIEKNIGDVTAQLQRLEIPLRKKVRAFFTSRSHQPRKPSKQYPVCAIHFIHTSFI